MADQWDQYKVSLADINNNPGNLTFAGQPGATPGEGGFAAFPSQDAGMSALRSQIKLDAGRGHTLGSYITKFAPPTENDTASYIKQAAAATSSTPDTPLAQIDHERLARFQAGLESGNPAIDEWNQYKVSPVDTAGVDTSKVDLGPAAKARPSAGMFTPQPMAPPAGGGADELPEGGLKKGVSAVQQKAFNTAGAPAIDVAKGVQAGRQGDPWQAAADIARGGLGAATLAGAGPMANAMYVAPIKTSLAALTSMAAGWLANKGATKMGATPPQAELAGDVAGVLPMARSVLRTGQRAQLPPLYETNQGMQPGALGPLERLDVAAAAKASRAQNYNDWDKAVNLSQQGAGMAANTPNAIADRVMAIGASKQLVPEQEWGHTVGEPPGGLTTRTERSKLEDVIAYLNVAQKRAWDRFDQNFLQPAMGANVKINATGVVHDVIQKLNPELLSERFVGQAEQNIENLTREYQGRVMTPKDIQNKVNNLNDLEYGVFQKSKVGQMNTLDTNVQMAFIDAERQVLLDKLIDATAPSDPDLARLERRQYGAITQLRNESLNQLGQASGTSQSIPRRAISFALRSGVEALMGQQRGAIANLASSLSTAPAVPNAGTLMSRAFQEYKFPYQLSQLGPQAYPAGATPQAAAAPGVSGLPAVRPKGAPANVTVSQGPPQLPAGPPPPPMNFAQRGEPLLPPGTPPALPPAGKPPIVTPPPPDASGPMRGQGAAPPIVDPATGEVKGYSGQTGTGIHFTDEPPAPYKLGDKRKINGVTYVRDLDGTWHPQH